MSLAGPHGEPFSVEDLVNHSSRMGASGKVEVDGG